MTAPIDDVTSLPGRKVTDQEENPIGEVKDIYTVDSDGQPAWVTIEASFGMANKRLVFIPLARLKDEDGDLRVPYSKEHIGNTPEVDGTEGISPEDERQLRDHFGIDRADQELRSDNNSYATLVPEEEGTLQQADDPGSLETPQANKVDDSTRERLHDPGSNEIREVDAGAIADENASRGSDSHSDSESSEEPKSDSHPESEKSADGGGGDRRS